jgi:hypothetical protein
MGGKRSDQYNIDPAEGSSTNHTWRHEGRSGDEHLADTEKQHLEANPHDQPMIPEHGVNPAVRDLRDARARHGAEAAGEPMGDAASGSGTSAARTAKPASGAPDSSNASKASTATNASDTSDDLVDEMSEDSFPASDPPPGPGHIGGVRRK